MIVRLIIIIFSVLLFQLAAPLPPVDYFNFCKNKFAALLLSMFEPMCCLQHCCHCCKAADGLCVYRTISFLCSVVSACCCHRCWLIVASSCKANFGGWCCHCPSLLRCVHCYCCRQQVLSPPLLLQPVGCCYVLFTKRTLLLLLSLRMRAAMH